jgi:ABC-type branched-subunit amino acid transport system permease subunit
MFCGYNPLYYKLFICGVRHAVRPGRGAVCAAGGHHQSGRNVAGQLHRIAIWVAVGGRGSLIGPVLGAGFINAAKSWFTVAFPEYWLFSWVGCSLPPRCSCRAACWACCAATRRMHDVRHYFASGTA